MPYSTQQAIDWYVTGLPMEMDTYCRRCRCDTIDEVITSVEAYETSTLNKRPKGRLQDEQKSKSSRQKRRAASSSSSESSASSESSKSEDSSSSEDEKKHKKGSKKKNRRMAAPEKGTTSIVSKVDALVKDFADLKVHVVGSQNKRKSPTGARPNLWCTNCGRVGHANVECRTYPVNAVEWVPAWEAGDIT